MTKLILLTGPAAGDVAAVLRAATPAADPRQGASCDPWWDEVRDYWDAPRCIAGVPDAVAIEHGIRDCPGGEEWLVGLVLPDTPYRGKSWGLRPARLAILAPDPPKLLIERVRAWGGDCWHLRSYDDGWCYITFEDGGSIRQVSWPEAVRAALGVSVSTGASGE